jgi:glycerophosphoryl diester phosphodiesterase
MSVNALSNLRASPGIIRVHGHRGARGVLPENTMLGFVQTFNAGVQIVELDVLVTADGEAVITHNPALKAASTRDESGEWLPEDGPLIAAVTYDELTRYDVGGLRPQTEYGDLYPDQAFLSGLHVPRLADLCALVARPPYTDRLLNIEIKSDPTLPQATPPIPDLVAATLSPILERGLSNRVILQSFDWRVLHECADQAPHIPRSYLSYLPRPNAPMTVTIYSGSPWMDGLRGENLPQIIAEDGGSVWSPYFQDLIARDVKVAHDLGLIVNVWTVNEPSNIDQMIALGVDGIISDYPARVQRRLMAHGFRWQ